MRKQFVFGVLPLVLSLVACSPSEIFESPEEQASQQAWQTARVETVVFAGTRVGTEVALQATVDNAVVMQTQLAQLEQENNILRGTVDAITTFGAPVIPRYTPTTTLSQTVLETSTSTIASNYMDLRTSTGVNPETGCALDKRGRYGADDSRIYVNMVGVQVRRGTTHQATWFYEETLRYESQVWTADQDYEEICIYFWLQPSYTPFDPGMWEVIFRVNDQPLSPIPFEICEIGQLC